MGRVKGSDVHHLRIMVYLFTSMIDELLEGKLTPAEMNSYIVIDQSDDKSNGNKEESSGAPKPNEKTVNIADGSNEVHEFVSQMVDQVVHQGLLDVPRPPGPDSTPAPARSTPPPAQSPLEFRGMKVYEYLRDFVPNAMVSSGTWLQMVNVVVKLCQCVSLAHLTTGGG